MARPRRRTARPRTVAPTEETAVIYEEAGPPPGELPTERELWPWMLVLLGLVLGGLAAAYFVTRDDDKKSKSATVTTTLAQTVAPATTPKPAAPGRVAVPKLVGMPAPVALAALQKLGLTGDARGVFSTRPRNEVVSQQPGVGTKLPKGATVIVRVSKGGKAVPVPDVVGQDQAAAISTVRAQGFEPNVIQVPSGEPAGQVVAQHPVGGKKAQPGSGVRLNVSGGEKSTTTTAATTTTTATTTAAPASVTVPDLKGKKLLAARKLIRKAGLVTEVKRVPNTLPKGRVVAQSPRAGTTAKRGAHVLINVSLGPPPAANAPSSVPDVVGLDEATATQDLQNAGFEVEVVREDTTDPVEDGIVIDQTPGAGEPAPAKTTVTIYVGRFSG